MIAIEITHKGKIIKGCVKKIRKQNCCLKPLQISHIIRIGVT